MSEFAATESTPELKKEAEVYNQPPSSVGNLLAQARRDLGIEIEKVAERLNLGTEIIEAIEAGETTDLLPRPFLQGHIRSYAKIVNLDPNVILPLWQKEFPQPESEKAVPVETESDKRIRRMHRQNKRMAGYGKKKKKPVFTILLLVVMAIVVGFALLSQQTKTDSSVKSLSVGNQPVASSGPALSIPKE